MRTGRKAEVHKTGGSNGPISCRPGVIALLRREEADHGNGEGDLDPSERGDETLDFSAVNALANERVAAALKPPTLGDILKSQNRS